MRQPDSFGRQDEMIPSVQRRLRQVVPRRRCGGTSGVARYFHGPCCVLDHRRGGRERPTCRPKCNVKAPKAQFCGKWGLLCRCRPNFGRLPLETVSVSECGTRSVQESAHTYRVAQPRRTPPTNDMFCEMGDRATLIAPRSEQQGESSLRFILCANKSDCLVACRAYGRRGARVFGYPPRTRTDPNGQSCRCPPQVVPT